MYKPGIQLLSLITNTKASESLVLVLILKIGYFNSFIFNNVFLIEFVFALEVESKFLLNFFKVSPELELLLSPQEPFVVLNNALIVALVPFKAIVNSFFFPNTLKARLIPSCNLFNLLLLLLLL